MSAAGRTIGLLGAEKQAAVSAALAWPELPFIFVSDQRVVDGWDLGNVRHEWARPGALGPLLDRPDVHWVPLCGRWLQPGLGPSNRLGRFDLATLFHRLERELGDVVLPVLPAAGSGARYIVKGNAWHRPDPPLIGTDFDRDEVADRHGCGLVYQPYWPWSRHYLATGCRGPEGIDLAVIQVHGEMCIRDDFLTSGQTVRHDRLAGLTRELVDVLDHRGFFTCNWLENGEEVRLTSLRPVPRALFRTLRRAGLGGFDPPGPGLRLAPAGLKFTVDTHYSSYHPLAA